MLESSQLVGYMPTWRNPQLGCFIKTSDGGAIKVDIELIIPTDRVEIKPPLPPRLPDTPGSCVKTKTGYAMLVNWNFGWINSDTGRWMAYDEVQSEYVETIHTPPALFVPLDEKGVK